MTQRRHPSQDGNRKFENPGRRERRRPAQAWYRCPVQISPQADKKWYFSRKSPFPETNDLIGPDMDRP